MSRDFSQVDYLEIEEHGIIGNCLTAALVGLDCRIDWFCYPYFDSPSIFGSLLDHKKGGYFKIQPVVSASSATQENDVRYKQFYWPDTNVLVTRFITQDCMGEIIDYMPAGLHESERGFQYLIRRVHVSRGHVRFHLHCLPAFNYGRDSHIATIEGETGQKCLFTTANFCAMQLLGTVPIRVEDNGAVVDFELKEGTSHIFAFGEAYDYQQVEPPSVEKEQDLFIRTVYYWKSWLSTCTYKGRWRELVHRSALALKLHCFQKTGAVLSSVTCLPAEIGSQYTQDHRVMYIGSTAFTVYALLQIGFVTEAKQLMEWVKMKCKQATQGLKDSLQCPLHHIFSISDTPLPCEVLSHLEGYKGSGPPRIGQASGAGQTRLHVFGDLLDAIYAYNQHAMEISYDLWEHLCVLIDWLCDHWRETDASIWESETRRDHYTYSKVMTWVAFDRALRLADSRAFPANRSRWLQVRDEIFLDVIRNGWNEQRQAFVQAYNSDLLDASVLIMPLVNFMAPSDPRMISTLDQVLKGPEEGGLRVANCLVFKFQLNDTMLHKEATYNVCSFWMIEALTRTGKRNPEKLKQARLYFEEMMGYANHLGVFCEELTYRGENAGNYLRTLVHFTLISTAFDLDQLLDHQSSHFA